MLGWILTGTAIYASFVGVTLLLAKRTVAPNAAPVGDRWSQRLEGRDLVFLILFFYVAFVLAPVGLTLLPSTHRGVIVEDGACAAGPGSRC